MLSEDQRQQNMQAIALSLCHAQAFCRPLVSAVVLCKLTIVAQELQQLLINNKTMCLNYILSECE